MKRGGRNGRKRDGGCKIAELAGGERRSTAENATGGNRFAGHCCMKLDSVILIINLSVTYGFLINPRPEGGPFRARDTPTSRSPRPYTTLGGMYECIALEFIF